jgi:NDP-sugar pyrophosphorylase family protein
MTPSLPPTIGAVILAGGLGTRLRSVTGETPKVLAPVLGRPYLCFVLDQLEQAGVDDVLICTGYKSAEVAAMIGRTHGRMSVRYSAEPDPLGTAGALRYALPDLHCEEFLVLNGDSFIEADLTTFASLHEDHGARASLLLTEVPDVSRYGRVEIDATGKITGFSEKGTTPARGTINAGVYLLRRDLIADLPAGLALSLEREVFPRLVGQEFYGFRLGKRFIDIGTPESYREVGDFFRNRGTKAGTRAQGATT